MVDNESTLILVQVVFRHGVRAPHEHATYPGDPYKDVTFEPFGKGQLTKYRRKQCYHFGKELRERYNDFLGPEYREPMLEAHCSEVARTRTTMQLVLAGLFPPTEATSVAQGLNWQLVQFNYKPLQEDPLIGAALVQADNVLSHNAFGKSANSDEVINHVEAKLNWKIEHSIQLGVIYDAIHSQVDLGFDVPDWADGIYEEKLKEERDHCMLYNMEREGYLRDACGDLINKILVDMEQMQTKEG